jgi:predicted esterase
MSLADPHEAQPVLRSGAELVDASAAVVLVHGRGGSADDILGLAAAIAQPGVAYLAPQAADHTWYPQRFLAPLAVNEPWLSSALAKLESVRRTLAEAGIGDERIVWFGFSQGACLASELVARNPRRWGGLVAAVGGRIGPPGTRFDEPGELAGTPIHLGCGDPDPHIPWSRVEESAAAFRRQGGAVELRRYPGFPHAVHPESIAFARRALAAARGD